MASLVILAISLAAPELTMSHVWLRKGRSSLASPLLHPANHLDDRQELQPQNKELSSILESSPSNDILLWAGDDDGHGPVM